MLNIKVLGSGCKNCEVTAEMIKKAAEELGKEIELTKVTDVKDIMAYKVMITPAVVIDEQLVHKGSVPKEEDVKSWLAEKN